MIRMLIIVSTLATLFTYSCQNEPDFTEAEIYKILNEIIADDTLPIYNLCHNVLEFEIEDEHAKEFTKEDIAFNNRQEQLFKDFEVRPGVLKSYRRGSKELNLVDVAIACDSGIVNYISFPIISIDRQKVLLNITEDCNCMLGGWGRKNLYIKKNGKWVRTKEFGVWIGDSAKHKENRWTFVT